MYAICAYIDHSNHPNVGIYTVHGASEYKLIYFVYKLYNISYITFNDYMAFSE